MLKKAREARDAAPDTGAADSSKSVLESSRQIWLAGLGAFSRAQAEGMKVFESLVKQGEAVETKTRQAASDTATAARHAAQSTAREVQQMAGGTWDKLEQVFEDRVARALARLGVHTQTDVERLSAARRRACGSGQRAHQVERRQAGREAAIIGRNASSRARYPRLRARRRAPPAPSRA